MQFAETGLAGAYLVEPEPIADDRGFFARTFCVGEFGERGLETSFLQHSISFSRRTGTLRGMHFQNPPHAETKLVSCSQGAIFDVIVDLRPASPTYLQWASFELTPDNRRQLYIPGGFAHGFITLNDDTVVQYLISKMHVPEASRGFCHDDPAVGIRWPMVPSVMSERDRSWPLLETVRA